MKRSTIMNMYAKRKGAFIIAEGAWLLWPSYEREGLVKIQVLRFSCNFEENFIARLHLIKLLVNSYLQ